MRMKKKYLALFLVLSLVFPLLCPCRVYAEETEEDHYGEDAYQYLTYINDNFPNRVNDHEVTPDTTALRACGEWLRSTMASFGYQAKTYGGTIEAHDFVTYAFTKPGNSPRKIVIGAHYDSVATRGCEDNGTGLALVLELAKRFANVPTPLTLEFCFFDGEETKGFAGSYLYIEQAGVSDVELYMNLDCLGAGDVMRVYGGMYEGDTLTNAWGYYMARALADDMGIPIYTMPEAVTKYRTPTRDSSSDQYYFARNGVPYVYFEANTWVKEDGTLGNAENEGYYNSADPGFAATNGQIYHTSFDDLAAIEAVVPGRIQSHLHDFSRLITRMLSETSEASKDVFTFYTEKPSVPEETEPAVIETPAEETVTEAPSVIEISSEETVVTTEAESGTTAPPIGAADGGNGSGKPDKEQIVTILMVIATVLGGVLLILAGYVMTIGKSTKGSSKKKKKKKRMSIR